jgi:hypothetical protein
MAVYLKVLNFNGNDFTTFKFKAFMTVYNGLRSENLVGQVMIGTSGKFHFDVWQDKEDAKGWECIKRGDFFSSYEEAENKCKEFLSQYKI